MPQHPVLMEMIKPPAGPGGGGLDIHEDGLVCFVEASEYGGSGLTWNDQSTQSNDHTWDTTAPSHTSGTSGYFDFTAAATDDTSGGSTNFSTGSGAWSIECWFYADVVNVFQTIWWIGTNGTTGGAQGLWLSIDNGGSLLVETASGAQIYGPSMSATTWYSVLVTYDGTTLEIFVDNVSQTTSAQSLNITFGTVVIGQDAVYGDRFDGRIAAFIAYDDELTSGERGTNYTEHTSRY